MPIYEFECPKGHITERLCSAGEAATILCDCGDSARRIMSRVQIKIDAPAASGADDLKAAHDHWMASPEGQKVFKEKEAEGWELKTVKSLRDT